MPQGDPRPGEKYLHFKNKLYQVLTIAQHSETGEKMVIYQALYGTFEIYARPFSMFVSPVDKEKYPQAKQKYRFQWVEFKKTAKQAEQKEASRPELSGKKEASGPELPGKKEASGPELPGKKEASGPKLPEQGEVSTMGVAEQEAATPEPVNPPLTAEEKLLAFFDADTLEEKYAILVDMRDEVTDRMINSMAVVMDVVIEEGPLDLRYEELKACLRTMQRYECSRLR